MITVGTKVKFTSLNPVRRKEYTGTVVERNTDKNATGVQWWIAPDTKPGFEGDIVNWVSRSEDEIEVIAQ